MGGSFRFRASKLVDSRRNSRCDGSVSALRHDPPFLPQILPNDVIRLDVEPVISELNFAQGTTVGTGQVPSITERSARTVVELREGQTLAIAGLLQNTTNASTVESQG